MTIEIHQPELEALIHQRMASGAFQSVEDVLMQALKSSPAPQPIPDHPAKVRRPGRKSLAQLFAESPFKGLDIEFPRDKSPLRPIEL